MTMRRAVFPFLLASILVACAAGPGRLEASLNSLVGRPEAEALKEFGWPQRSLPLADGSHVLRYEREHTVQYGGLPRPPAEAQEANAAATKGLSTGTYDPAGKVFQPAASSPVQIDVASACGFDVSVDAKGVVRGWAARRDCRAK